MGGDAIPAGMKRWGGGDKAPADWDGGPVWLACGQEGIGANWRHSGRKGPGWIVAYTPKPDAKPDDGDRDAAVVEAMARAIEEVQLWERFNDWTADSVQDLPVEICRYGDDGEDEIVVVERHPVSDRNGRALYLAIRSARARAALSAYRAHQEAF